MAEAPFTRTFLAKDPRLGREVAIKVLTDEGRAEGTREILEERLREEGRHAASLWNPHLTALLDAGEDDQHGPFLVFEHVAGPSLRERLAQGPSSSAQVSRLARELGGALTHLHDAGLVHHNVRLESVRLSETGAKLGDFDMLAPTGTDSDAHADELALASALYEALTGHPPVAGQDPKIGSRAQVVFARAFHRDPGHRFPSCRAFGEALATSIQGGVPHQSAPPDAMPLRLSTVPRATRKTQNMLAGTALTVILLLFFYGRHPSPEPSAALRKPDVSHDGSMQHTRVKERATVPRAPSDSGRREGDAVETPVNEVNETR